MAAARRPAPVSGCTSGAARRLSCTPGVPGDRGRPLRSTAPEGGVGGGKRRWGTGGGRRGLLPLRAFLSPSSPPPRRTGTRVAVMAARPRGRACVGRSLPRGARPSARPRGGRVWRGQAPRLRLVAVLVAPTSPGVLSRCPDRCGDVTLSRAGPKPRQTRDGHSWRMGPLFSLCPRAPLLSCPPEGGVWGGEGCGIRPDLACPASRLTALAGPGSP